MAIKQKIITFARKSDFLGAANGIGDASTGNPLTVATNGYWNNIPAYSIVFIKDTGEIWHNGTYFSMVGQVAAYSPNLTAGIVFRNTDDNFYFRKYLLWGNTFDGTNASIDEAIRIKNHRVYDENGIYELNTTASANDGVITFSGFDVAIPNGKLVVSGGNLEVETLNAGNVFKVTTEGIVSANNYVSAKYLLNTNSYFSTSYPLGKTWTSIQQFSSSGQISLENTRPAIINIQASAFATNTNWQPWIAGGDTTSQSSWGIGLGGDAFYIGRVAKTQTSNSLTNYWKFNYTGSLEAASFVKSGGTSSQFLKADGSVDESSYCTADHTHDAYLPLAGGTMTGLLNASPGLQIGNTTISPQGNDISFQSEGALRFGVGAESSKWAGLKYDSTAKIIYLGVPDNNIFSSNGNVISDATLTLLGISKVNIGSSGDYNLNVNGTAGATAFYQTSDIRLKNVESEISLDIKDVAKLPIFNFSWNTGETGVYSGTSAQDVQKILPNLVTGENKLSLNYSSLGTILGITSAREIVLLKNKISELENLVRHLNIIINELIN